MASSCDSCGYRTNEVRSGGSIPDHGTRISLTIDDADDLNRDVLKSESCRILIPEYGLDVSMASLGGRFTTVEGLLRQIREEMMEKVPFFTGDSATHSQKESLSKILDTLDDIACGRRCCTLILDDPLSNSYVQNICAPDPDPKLVLETYKRSHEQDDEYGLNDMRVDEYQDSTEN